MVKRNGMVRYRVIKWRAIGRHLKTSGVFVIWRGGECLFVGKGLRIGGAARRALGRHEPHQFREEVKVELITGLSKANEGRIVRVCKLEYKPKYNKKPAPFPTAYTRKRGQELLRELQEHRDNN